MDDRGMTYVSVIGGYDADPATLADAEEVGRLLAEAGSVVVTGGRSGVSAAASKGAAEAGGVALGILPGRDRSQANPWLTYAVTTGLGDTRNALVAMNGDAVIALDGAYGTLSEMAHALNEGKTVIGLGAWQLRRAGTDDAAVVQVATAAEAVAAALKAARS
ncbi:MAG: LOG family protein [Acidimicrobiales bacterium]|jgi:hypothetical protein|nr:LOG family protein [Acidimicrobiales bacterium]